MVYKFFDEKFSRGVIKSKVDTCADTATLNDQLSDEFQKPNVKNFEKWKTYLSFINNIWGTNLIDMQLLSR